MMGYIVDPRMCASTTGCKRRTCVVSREDLKPEAERFHWSKFTDLLGFEIFTQHLGFDDLPHFSSHLRMNSIPWEMWPGTLNILRGKLVFQSGSREGLMERQLRVENLNQEDIMCPVRGREDMGNSALGAN